MNEQLRFFTGRFFAGASMLVLASSAAYAQAARAGGQQIAFDRSKGNCLTCHAIKGGESPGTIGPRWLI